MKIAEAYNNDVISGGNYRGLRSMQVFAMLLMFFTNKTFERNTAINMYQKVPALVSATIKGSTWK